MKCPIRLSCLFDLFPNWIMYSGWNLALFIFRVTFLLHRSAILRYPFLPGSNSHFTEIYLLNKGSRRIQYSKDYFFKLRDSRSFASGKSRSLNTGANFFRGNHWIRKTMSPMSFRWGRIFMFIQFTPFVITTFFLTFFLKGVNALFKVVSPRTKIFFAGQARILTVERIKQFNIILL